MPENTVEILKEKAAQIRKDLLSLCLKEAIHIGGDLSSADIMTVLWQKQMRYDPKNPKWEGRDRFVLSKGHALALLAFEQAMLGCYSKDIVFKEYAQDDGMFAMHACNLKNPFIEVSTGSLGHGIAVASGMAAGLKKKGNSENRVYVLMGDGEQSEGSVWEAIMSAAQYRLGNLVVLIDNNNLEADGVFSEMTSCGNLAEKYRAFGWNAVECDGHSIEEIVRVFENLPPVESEKPTVIVCHTVKGKGVPFMENQVGWHAGKITTEQLKEIYNENAWV